MATVNRITLSILIRRSLRLAWRTLLRGPPSCRCFTLFLRPPARVILVSMPDWSTGLLTAKRKEAIQGFWTSYFAATIEPAEIRFDGTGILPM